MLPSLQKLKPRRPAVAATVVLALILGGLVAYAVSAQGFPRHRADLSDGGVWVSGNKVQAFGRVNKPIQQLDGYLPLNSGQLDVAQDGSAVLGSDVANGRLLAINPATVAAPSSARANLQAGSTVAVRGGTAAVLVPATGALRVVEAQPSSAITQVSQLDTTSKPFRTLGADAAMAVTSGGSVIVFSAAKHQLTTVDRKDATFHVVSTRTVDPAFDAGTQVSSVGATAVLLDPGSGRLQVVGGPAVDVPSASALQQPGPSASAVVVETQDKLIEVDLSSGRQSTIGTGAGKVTAPVRVGPCVYGAWSDTGATFTKCDGATGYPYTLQETEATSDLVFRVNRTQVLLNDRATGNAWDVDHEPELVTRWQDFKRTDNNKSNADKNKTNDSEDKRKPRALPDKLGARGGATTILHPLDNDSTATGRTLAITSVGPVSGSRGVARTAPDGQSVNFTLPAGSTSGTSTFEYYVSDGGPTAHATVTVTAHGADQLAQPRVRQGYKPVSYHVPAAGVIEIPVLADWRDPDAGDPLNVVSAEASAGLVNVTNDGRIRYTAPPASGTRTVTYGVAGSNGPTATKAVTFVVQKPTDPVSWPARAEPDVVSGTVGKPIVFKPLANDLPGSDPSTPNARLRLASDVIRGQGTDFPGDIDTELRTGIVTLRPKAPGTYFLADQVGYGNARFARGTIRVDVRQEASKQPIAVPDQLTLYGQESGLVDVLTNDVDPQGGLLTVVNATPALQGDDNRLQVAVVDGRYLRVRSSSEALSPNPQVVHYTVSNGNQKASGDVTITGRDPKADNQPVTAPDTATVRAGTSVAVPALDNDFSPNGGQLTLLTDLGEGAAGELPVDPKVGHAYVSGRLVRYVAPADVQATTPVTIRYVARDQEGNRSPSTDIVVNVVPTSQANRPPAPLDLEGRVVAGDTIKVKLPGGTLDPDGDPVTVAAITTAPKLGRITRTAANAIWYQAFPGAAGTDTFGYQVVDPSGDVGTANVRVSVVDPSQPQPPLALDDGLTVAPGRIATIDVVANDFVAPGDKVKVTLLDAPPGAKLVTEDGPLVVPGPTRPDEPVKVTYQIDNGIESSRAVVTVNAQEGYNNPPVVFDAFGTLDEAVSSTVDVLATAYDPDSSDDQLAVSVLPPPGTTATATDGKITVKRTSRPQVVPYRVTDADGGTATAVFYVPALGAGPPYADPKAVIRVQPGKSVTPKLSSLVIDPAGKQVSVGFRKKVVGAPSPQVAVRAASATSIRVTAAAGYLGPGSASFPVYDGESIADPTGQKAFITVPVVVGDAKALLSCPKDAITLYQGGDPKDLDVGSLCHAWTPDPDSRRTLEFTASWASGHDLGGVDVGGSGKRIKLTPTRDARAGTSGLLRVKVAGSTGPAGLLAIDVEASPPPSVVPVTLEFRSNSTHTIPLAGKLISPLNDPKAEVVEASSVPGVQVTRAGSSVTLKIGSTFGRKRIPFTMTDAPGDSAGARKVKGFINLNILDVPATPKAPQAVPGIRSRAVLLEWKAPEDHGSGIIRYKVTYNGGSQVCLSTRCTIDHPPLDNGGHYRFQVIAINAIGPSLPSPSSNEAVPDEAPLAVSGLKVVRVKDGALDVTWKPPANVGTISKLKPYVITWGNGGRTTSTTPSATIRGLDNATTYSITVQALDQSFPGPPTTFEGPYQSAGRPQAPENFTVEPQSLGGDEAVVNLSWSALTSAQANGPKGSVRYVVTEKGAPVCPASKDTSCVLRMAFNGDTHTYALTATTTDMLQGSHTSPTTKKTFKAYGNPDEPTIDKVTPGDKSLTVDYTTGASRGNLYDFTCRINGSPCDGWNVTGPESRSRTITGLANGQSYEVVLKLCNGNGSATGCASDSSAGNVPFGDIGAVTIDNVSTSGPTVSYTVTVDPNGKAVAVDTGGQHYTNSSTSPWTTPTVTVNAGYDSTANLDATAADGDGRSRNAPGKSAHTTPRPNLTVGYGGHEQNGTYCYTAPCRRIVVNGYNLAPNTAYELYFNTDCAGLNPTLTADCTGGGSPGHQEHYQHETISTGSNGSFSDNQRFFGYTNSHVWVDLVVFGETVTSPKTTWPN